MPIVETLRNHWKLVLLAALCFANVGAILYALFTFSITYGTTYIGLSRNTMLLVAVACSVAAFFGIPIAGVLSDRFGRRAVFTTGIVLTIVIAFPMFWLIDSGSVLFDGDRLFAGHDRVLCVIRNFRRLVRGGVHCIDSLHRYVSGIGHRNGSRICIRADHLP